MAGRAEIRPGDGDLAGIWPPTLLLITNCGCELSCGPRLPLAGPVLAIVSPLKVIPPSDDTTSMIRLGLNGISTLGFAGWMSPLAQAT